MSDASSDAIMLARAKKKAKSKQRADVVKRRDVAKWNRAVKDADEYLVSGHIFLPPLPEEHHPLNTHPLPHRYVHRGRSILATPDRRWFAASRW